MSIASVLSVVEVVENSLPETLSVSEIAKRCGLSRSNLQHQFKNKTGLTISQYQSRRLLSLAAGEIANTDRRILDIALDYGFESQEAFARAFKRFAWVAPKNLREQPVWAARVEFPAIDKAVLEKLTYLKSLPLVENAAPASRWACYGFEVDSLARQADEMDLAIYQNFERFYGQPFARHFEGLGSHIVEFWDHCQFANSRFPLAIGFEVDAEKAIPQEMVEVHVPPRRTMTITLPGSDYIREMGMCLPYRLKDELGLKFGLPPHFWLASPDSRALHFTFSVEDISDDSLDDLLTAFSASLETLRVTGQGLEPLCFPQGKNLGTRRLSTLFSEFQDVLTAVSIQDDGQVILDNMVHGEDAQVQGFFTSPESTEGLSFEGLYLITEWEGDDIYCVENRLETLYHALNHSPAIYLYPGFEVIRNLSLEQGYFAFQLLIPVRFRRGSSSV